MSRGIFQALSKLKTMIEAIDPKTDSHHGFICIDDGSGLVSPLNTRFQSQRQFTLEIVSLAMDDGSAGPLDRDWETRPEPSSMQIKP